MSRWFTVTSLFTLLALAARAVGQNPPASDPKALAYAAQSVVALTGGTNISDVTLTGTATWSVASDTETGTATLSALGTGESRMDLRLTSGTQTEIRDASTGIAQGRWITQSGATGPFAPHNCMTDAAWFFPVLGSLAAGPGVVLSYIGQESRNNATVQHIQSRMYRANLPSPIPSPSIPSPQQLSTVDFYLDATTLLPVSVTFNTHPDNDSAINIPMEIDFLSYQIVGGVNVPTHIQQYFQGSLTVDLTISNASFNTGIPLSNFSIN